jgi:hypothetical protein
MAMVVFTIETKLGITNRESLEWMRPVVAKYDGINAHVNTKALDVIDTTLAMSDQEIDVVNLATKSNPDVGMNLQKYSIPMFEAKLSLLSHFEHHPRLQSQLLEVRQGVEMFNDLADRARFYQELTFSSGISEKNHGRAVQNQISTYKDALKRAKVIADQIGKIKWC